MNVRLTVRCARNHVQELVMRGVPDEQWMKIYCGLLDGTGDVYLRKPADDPGSIIGKCGLCGAQVKATFEVLPENLDTERI